LRARGQQPRARVLPRAPGDTRHARVRRVLRDASYAPRPDRPDPGYEPRDGDARAVDGDRPGEGAPDPDRDRRRVLPTTDRRVADGIARAARPARLGLRHRVVPEG